MIINDILSKKLTCSCQNLAKAIAEIAGTIPTLQQVQADWNQTDSTSVDFIKNKPTITAPVQSDWNQADSTSLSFIKNKPTITDPVQSDWEEADEASLAFIKNKPNE